MTNEWKPLKIAIVGAGIGGLAAAIALRRHGHEVHIYEKHDFAHEVGASISCAANGGRHLVEWGVDVKAAKPVFLKDLIRHDWETGKVKAIYPFEDYSDKYGVPYFMFHRKDIHTVLLNTALGDKIDGNPCELHVNHNAVKWEDNTVYFENGRSVTADLIIGADGVGSTMRKLIGVKPDYHPSTSCCYRCLVTNEDVQKYNFYDFTKNGAIEFWGGEGIDKIVISPCSNGDIISFYCFYPSSYNNLRKDGWDNDATLEQLLDTFPKLDSQIRDMFKRAFDIKQWRLYVHEEYETWSNGNTTLMSDAAHPMLPDQSQGACQAIEDAAALGYIFSKKFNFSVPDGLKIYEQVRKPRATKVQKASARAREDLSERIGFSASVDKPGKLTIEEICGYDIKADVDRKAAALFDSSKL
ncbi:hypothetical protein TRICI_005373 [Trichomonascus ciferrii]|uniref:FAD-binding domain-containing protein n=1 Tax=Trichomonascus ciferrii TaxID=44093 RepID=A0A642UXV9_9ASCO|nr:hypothetical protein TRICI_005373 [Trichomonascus ciferrii]